MNSFLQNGNIKHEPFKDILITINIIQIEISQHRANLNISTRITSYKSWIMMYFKGAKWLKDVSVRD